MKGISIRFGHVGALALAASMLAGCAGNRLKQERDALFIQNEELQQQLTHSRAALDACEAERENLLGRVGQLESAAAVPAQPAPVLPGPALPPVLPGASANTGFSGIEGVETIQGRDRITVRVPGDILFAPGKASVRDSAQKTLDRIAEVIRRDYGGKRVRVEGYTDTDPIRKSNWQDNLDLSLARAASVHRYLQKKGVDAKRLEAVGLGEWHPRSSKQASRRVEIVVVTSE